MRQNLSIKRRTILDTVNRSDTPMTAKDIFEIHKKNINLATVYRALGYLEKYDMIKAFTLACSKEGIVRFYHRKIEPHVHFFHCEQCHKFIPVSSCPLASLHNTITSEGCIVNTHTLYFTGICKLCSDVKA
ncbi:MAG: transcriptional repressor [Desulfamplus sp.]|nr:transcriptional repressor [Desulfamplus sp.]